MNTGEWQTDKNGKRYRMVGNTKEYELEINGVPQSVFLESNRQQREKRKIEIAEEQRKAAEMRKLQRYCPFRDGINTNCTLEKCALYENGCALVRWHAGMDTEGKECPINRYHRKCRKDCALYLDGCTLTGIGG